MKIFTARCIYAGHESTNGGVPTAWLLILLENMSLSFTLSWEGDAFKLLGLLVDCELVMDSGIDKILTQARPNIRNIIRHVLIIVWRN